jgi:hypothetical protein
MLSTGGRTPGACYGDTLLKWYTFLQPACRGIEDLAHADESTRISPTDPTDWSSIAQGGLNGIYLVMVGFAYWATAIKLQDTPLDQARFDGWVLDFIWVLEELIVGVKFGEIDWLESSKRDSSEAGVEESGVQTRKRARVG